MVQSKVHFSFPSYVKFFKLNSYLLHMEIVEYCFGNVNVRKYYTPSHVYIMMCSLNYVNTSQGCDLSQNL